MRSGVNPGTHILGPDPVSAYFGLYLCFNDVQSSWDHMFMGLTFIEDYIFLVKKSFLTKFKKLALQRNFDVNKIPSIGRPVFCSNRSDWGGLNC